MGQQQSHGQSVYPEAGAPQASVNTQTLLANLSKEAIQWMFWPIPTQGANLASPSQQLNRLGKLLMILLEEPALWHRLNT